LSLKITIRGFQSIKNPVEILIDGYCTIEGESNLGKSAVVRALHAAVSNRIGTEFITEGVEDCDIAIESPNHSLKWLKTRKATVYEVDGKAIHKPGKGTIPDEVMVLGIAAIKTIDRELHWPQIHFQWEQPFIIGSHTDTTAAELLGASQDTATISRAIKLVNSDVAKCKIKADLLEKQHQELTVSVTKMEELSLKLNALQQEADQKERERNTALKKETVYRDLITRYRNAWRGWKVSSTAAKAAVPAHLDVSYHEKLTDLYRRYLRAQALNNISSKSYPIPKIPDACERVVEVTRLYRESNRLLQRIQVLGQAIKLPRIQCPDLQKIVVRIASLKSLQKQFLKAQKDLDSSVQLNGKITIELKQLEEERKQIEYLVSSIEKCPLCSAPMKDGVFCPH
jgi:hypothetical protein